MDNQKQNPAKNKAEKEQYQNKANEHEVKNTKEQPKESKHRQENDAQ